MQECCKWYINDIKPLKDAHMNGELKWVENRKCTTCTTEYQVYFVAEKNEEIREGWEVWVDDATMFRK